MLRHLTTKNIAIGTLCVLAAYFIILALRMLVIVNSY